MEGNSTTLPFSRATVTLRGAFSKLDDITINGNTAATDGGAALLNLTGTATATNWTVSGNQVTGSGTTAAVAGGIDVVGGTLRLNHATVAENSAAGNADDLRTSSGFGGSSTGTIDVLNSIIDGSSAAGAVACAHDGGPIVSFGHNLDRGSSCGFTAAGDLSNVDPVLGALTTPKFVGQPAVRPLGYGSPAVNAADTANCPPTDALGTTRPQGSACDIGSFEATVTNLALAFGVDHASLPVGGGRVTYTATVSNLSANVPQTVTFSDTLPAGVHATSATASQGTCTTTPAVSCALGAVHRGTDVTVTVVANLSASGAQVTQLTCRASCPTATSATTRPPRPRTSPLRRPRSQCSATCGISAAQLPTRSGTRQAPARRDHRLPRLGSRHDDADVPEKDCRRPGRPQMRRPTPRAPSGQAASMHAPGRSRDPAAPRRCRRELASLHRPDRGQGAPPRNLRAPRGRAPRREKELQAGPDRVLDQLIIRASRRRPYNGGSLRHGARAGVVEYDVPCGRHAAVLRRGWGGRDSLECWSR